mgnify:CR=1 FL=1
MNKQIENVELLMIRSWIQTRFINGQDVIWGSDDVLKGASLTVKELEDLAGLIAKAVKG